MESRENLVEELSQEIQRSGTLTVLHTNAIANNLPPSVSNTARDTIISTTTVSYSQFESFWKKSNKF